ncbi:putative Pheromone-regulated membrane protein 10 [Paratrimastix pyriformis]|uniref:Pheromone-regulated membrane protein 10 n=1 Tax=Paratrimastix pyriformis TaxID=342808 RepID=A0ABQ8UKQ8_9EUKA|nr:putative Pheromone-regulated membrane protein 10 [Paratrimastix pyriformis]
MSEMSTDPLTVQTSEPDEAAAPAAEAPAEGPVAAPPLGWSQPYEEPPQGGGDDQHPLLVHPAPSVAVPEQAVLLPGALSTQQLASGAPSAALAAHHRGHIHSLPKRIQRRDRRDVLPRYQVTRTQSQALLGGAGIGPEGPPLPPPGGEIEMAVSRSPTPPPVAGRRKMGTTELARMPREPELSKAEFFAIVDFLVALAMGLHQYGLPCHRLQHNMINCSKRFGIEASFAVLPTFIQASFRRPNTQKVYPRNIVVDMGYNFEKLDDVDHLAELVASKQVTLQEGIIELQYIHLRTCRYSWWMKLIFMILMSTVIAPLFFGGGLVEMAVSFVCGLVEGLLLLWAERCVSIALGTGWFGPTMVGAISLAGVVWALPGLPFTLAAIDLATRNMVTGTSRLLYTLLITMELGFGLALGTRVLYFFVRPGPGPCTCTCTPTAVHIGLHCARLASSGLSLSPPSAAAKEQENRHRRSRRRHRLFCAGTSPNAPALPALPHSPAGPVAAFCGTALESLANMTAQLGPFLASSLTRAPASALMGALAVPLETIAAQCAGTATKVLEAVPGASVAAAAPLAAATALLGAGNGTTTLPTMPISPYWNILWVVIGGATFGFMLEASWRQMLVIIPASGVAVGASLLVSRFIASELAPVIAQTCLGPCCLDQGRPLIFAFDWDALSAAVFCNLYSRWTGHTAFVPLASATLMLVPGSVGVKGVTAMVTNDMVNGMQFGVSMFTVAISLVVGGFLANMIVPPQKDT